MLVSSRTLYNGASGINGEALCFFLKERFIEWVNTHENVHWVQMAEMAKEFRARVKPVEGAKMPRGFIDA